MTRSLRGSGAPSADTGRNKTRPAEEKDARAKPWPRKAQSPADEAGRAGRAASGRRMFPFRETSLGLALLILHFLYGGRSKKRSGRDFRGRRARRLCQRDLGKRNL